MMERRDYRYTWHGKAKAENLIEKNGDQWRFVIDCCSFHEILQQNCDSFKDSIALIGENRVYTYHALIEKSFQLAHHLVNNLGVKAGDRIVLADRNSELFCIGLLGINMVGAIAVPLNTKLPVTELAGRIKSVEASVIIGARSIIDELKHKDFYCSFIDHTILDGLEKSLNKEGFIYKWQNDDPAFLLFTSGTTGTSSPVILTMGNVLQAAATFKYCYDLGRSSKTLIAAPIFHGTGLFAQLIPIWYSGGTVVLLHTFSSRIMHDLINRHAINHMVSAPVVYRYLLNEIHNTNTPTETLQVIGVGGAPMSPEFYREIKKALPQVKVLNSYGLTEATSPGLIMLPEFADEKAGSIGVPTPTIDVRVVSDGKDIEYGVGELQLKGAIISPGYYGDTGRDLKTTDGWLATGDIVRIDEHGFFYIIDRLKDMINVGGEKVFSLQVEEKIVEIPGVQNVAVVKGNDPFYGEVPVAFIVPDKSKVTKETIQKYTSGVLPKHSVPKRIWFVEALPVNDTGKVLKNKLEELDREFNKQ